MINSNVDDIVKRRMANTNESQDEATANVRRLVNIIATDIRQDWVEEWTDPGPWEDNVEADSWVRSRPPVIHALMLRFPPSCVVRARVPLNTPAPGTVGIVSSYEETGLIGVLQHPEGKVRAMCNPEDLEVVGYWRVWTPDKVQQVLRATNEVQLPS